MKRPLRAYVPHTLLIFAALSGAWVFGGILRFLAGYQGAIEYKIRTGAWGWVEGMMVSMDAGRVFVAVVVQTVVLLIAIRDSRKNAALYPKWFFVLLTAFCAPLGVGYYVSLGAFGLLPN
jgi:hypothetical protein